MAETTGPLIRTVRRIGLILRLNRLRIMVYVFLYENENINPQYIKAGFIMAAATCLLGTAYIITGYGLGKIVFSFAMAPLVMVLCVFIGLIEGVPKKKGDDQ